MKENKYDDPVFFAKYGQMSRSVPGIIRSGGMAHTLKKYFRISSPAKKCWILDAAMGGIALTLPQKELAMF